MVASAVARRARRHGQRRATGRRYAAATRVADRLGRALGGLAATFSCVVTGRRACPDWPAAHWAPVEWRPPDRPRWRQPSAANSAAASHVAAGDVLSRNGVDVVLDLALPVERLVLRRPPVASRPASRSIAAAPCSRRPPSPAAADRLLQVTPTPARVSAGAVVEAIAAAAAPLIAASRVVDPVPVSIALATYVDPAGQPYCPGSSVLYAPLGEIPLGEVLGRR